MKKKTTTTTEYDENGKPSRIVVEEVEYADGGPVGPEHLPKGHPWRGPDPLPGGGNWRWFVDPYYPNGLGPVTCGTTTTNPNTYEVKIDASELNRVLKTWNLDSDGKWDRPIKRGGKILATDQGLEDLGAVRVTGE